MKTTTCSGCEHWLLKLIRDCRGQALAETAVSLVFLLMIMTGIFSIGIAIARDIQLTQAVGAGAQYLQQIRTTTSDPCADTYNVITTSAPLLQSDSITVTVNMNGTTPSQSGNSCAGAQSYLVMGAPVTVTATFPCDIKVYGVDIFSSCHLQAQVTEYEY